jgi:hypothetical protein
LCKASRKSPQAVTGHSDFRYWGEDGLTTMNTAWDPVITSECKPDGIFPVFRTLAKLGHVTKARASHAGAQWLSDQSSMGQENATRN